jgi:hypothetical protein
MPRIVSTIIFGCLASGCATLPVDKAATFQKVADANEEAFSSIAKIEESSIAKRAELLGSKRPGDFVVEGCNPPFSGISDNQKCSVTFNPLGDPPLVPTLAAPKSRALIAAISRYAGKMSELTTAKDVASAQAAVDSLDKTIAGIAIASGIGAPAGAIIELVAVMTKAQFMAERRRVLSAAAVKAQGPINAAAKVMSDISIGLQQNIAVSAADRIKLSVLDAQKEQGLLDCIVGTKPLPSGSAYPEANCAEIRKAGVWQKALLERAARTRLAASSADLFKAATDYNEAMGLRTDYSPLTKANRDLVESLAGNGFSAGAALTNLNSVVGALNPTK